MKTETWNADRLLGRHIIGYPLNGRRRDYLVLSVEDGKVRMKSIKHKLIETVPISTLFADSYTQII